MDISHFNEVERIQAIRLVRKLAYLKKTTTTTTTRGHSSGDNEEEEITTATIDMTSTPVVPRSLVASIVSVSLGGAEERDRVYRTCVAVLCELGEFEAAAAAVVVVCKSVTHFIAFSVCQRT